MVHLISGFLLFEGLFVWLSHCLKKNQWDNFESLMSTLYHYSLLCVPVLSFCLKKKVPKKSNFFFNRSAEKKGLCDLYQPALFGRVGLVILAMIATIWLLVVVWLLFFMLIHRLVYAIIKALPKKSGQATIG